MAKAWKRGRGKLGFLQPLLGRWAAEAESPMGPLRCLRVFEPVLNGAFIRLEARWSFGPSAAKTQEQHPDPPPKGRGAYQETALIGVGDEGKVCFWSFTSDGKRSQGTVADVTDLHKEAVGFEARMAAGLARMAYWPDDAGVFSG